MYFDGCSKNNPGDAGIGIVIYKNDEEIVAECDYIGIKTNNEAEYNALILGLNWQSKMVSKYWQFTAIVC